VQVAGRNRTRKCGRLARRTAKVSVTDSKKAAGLRAAAVRDAAVRLLVAGRVGEQSSGIRDKARLQRGDWLNLICGPTKSTAWEDEVTVLPRTKSRVVKECACSRGSCNWEILYEKSD
jgi:hypothetical protein